MNWLTSGGSGWTGPYEVKRVDAAEGNLTVEMGGRLRPYRFPDVRYSLLVFLSFFEGIFGHSHNAVAQLLNFIGGFSKTLRAYYSSSNVSGC